MNLWKPLAIVSTSALVFVVGYQAASAGSGGGGSQSVQGKQPNMEAALKSSEATIASLEKAEHDKGGWRANALALEKIVQNEIKRGIAFADDKK
jgi:hypothetical protein